MVFRGRSNPRGRGFVRPFRARGRGRRPFQYRGQNRGGYGRGRDDEGLRITLRNTGRDRRDEEEYDRHDRESGRRDSYDEYADDCEEHGSNDYKQETSYEDSPRGERGSGTPPRKRPHMESELAEDESLRITVGNDAYEERFSDQQQSSHTSEWEQERRERKESWTEEHREEPYYDRRSTEQRRYSRDDDKQEDRSSSRPGDRGRGSGYYKRGYDPNYRGRGNRSRGDFRGGFRGRWRGHDNYERGGRGRGYYYDRSRGNYHSRDRRSFDNDYDRDGHRRRSLSRDRGRSRSRNRYSRSPGRRRSYSRSYSRGRSRSHDRRSSERRSYSRGRRSFSRDRRSYSREKRRHSRERRSYSPSRRRSRSSSSSRSYDRSRHGSSRSYSRSPNRRSISHSRSGSPVRRGQVSPRNTPSGTADMAYTSEKGMSPRPRSLRRSLSRGHDQHSPVERRERRGRSSSTSSSSSSSDSRSRESPAELSEKQYEEEMYRRLKSEIMSDKEPSEREESIAKHIREMAKLSPVLFRHFMAKNAGNLSTLAFLQTEQQEQERIEESGDANDPQNARPLRSILKKKANSRSPSLDRNPSPPEEQPKTLTQIEKVIQALRKGGAKREEQSPEKSKEAAPPPTGALRQLSSYMDIEEEEEFLYGDNTKKPESGAPDSATPSGPFWSAGRFNEKRQDEGTVLYTAAEQSEQPLASKPSLDMFEDRPSASQSTENVTIPPAFSSFEEKEKSFEKWRASVFQKQTTEKPKEAATVQSTNEGDDPAEQLSSTVENILKSIGFNFELSQRMQELARQKKEGEQEAIRINQSASFLGANPDSLAEDLSNVFEKETKDPKPLMTEFMKEVEAATKAAREKAQRAKEAEERRVHGPTSTTTDRDSQRDRGKGSSRVTDLPAKSRKDSDRSSGLSRYGVHSTTDHSPYDPTVQDYRQESLQPQQQKFGHGIQDYEHFQDPGDIFERSQQSRSVRTSNLISLGGDSSSSQSKGYDKHDRNTEETTSYKRSGERILIVKKEETARTDSPGSDSQFSRRIVLPPKEKGKTIQVKTPDSDTRKDGKRRAASPGSPRSAKVSRRSPSFEDMERIVYQKSKSKRQTDTHEPQSPQRSTYESKYKYQAPEGGRRNTDSKAKPESVGSKADYLRSKTKEELSKSSSKMESSIVKNAVTSASDKAQFLERKRKLATLESELDALRQQHNELLRKRRRQKDGHKDPLIAENTKLQEEITAQIKALRDGSITVGGFYADKSSDGLSADKSSSVPSGLSSKKLSSKTDSVEKETPKVRYEYFDPGSHWCSTCNIVCGHMFDFFKHIESKKHQQKLDPFNRPWLLEAMQKQEKKTKPEGPVQAHPIKGLEFMMATAAFYCSICSEFCGDLSLAESHMKSEAHHDKYQEYLSQHPYYEKRYMLERSAALSMQKQMSPIEDKSDSDDNGSDKQQSESSRKKSAMKSSEKISGKSRDDWREKIYKEKTLYADYEEEYQKKSSSKEKDRQRHREQSTDSFRSRREDRDDSREWKSSISGDRKDLKEDKGRDSDGSSPRASKKETTTASKTWEESETEMEIVDALKSENDQQLSVSDVTEQAKNDEKTNPDASKDEVRKEESKKENETEVKGKIPIKLTGKSGIKPSSAAPPWKALTRPIPKGTMQKRLLASRPQPAVTSAAMPNEQPAPLADFLTVGAKTSVPVLPDVENIPYPPDPKTQRKEAVEGFSKEKLKEMKMLGIDPVSLVPNVRPKPPPPPSQNLSHPTKEQLTSTSGAVGISMPEGTIAANISQDDSMSSGTGISAGMENTAAPYSVPHHLPLPLSSGTGMGMPTAPSLHPDPLVMSLSMPPPPLPYMSMMPVPDISVPPPGFMPVPDTSIPPPPFVPPLPPPLPAEPPAPPPAPPEFPLLPPTPPPPAPLPEEKEPEVQDPAPPPEPASSAGKPQDESSAAPTETQPEDAISEQQAPEPAETTAVQSDDPVSASESVLNSVAPESDQAESTAAVIDEPCSNVAVQDADDVAQDGSLVAEPGQATPSEEAEFALAETKTEASTSEEMPVSSAEASISAAVPESPESVSEPQPSTSASEATLSSEAVEASSTEASSSPTKRTATARRGRPARKAVSVITSPAEEPAPSEANGAAAAASKRPRTRSQGKSQPQRQTRSRTRQQKIEEEEEEDSVTASDEGGPVKSEGEVGSSSIQEAETADGSKASSTSACVLDLTSPPADSSGGSEANTEVTSSSTDIKTSSVTTSPPADSALNLTVPPEMREARQGRVEQTMPEDLSSYAEPQDLSTSSDGRGRGRRPPEMPIDLTMRLAPSVDSSLSEEDPNPVEMQSSPGSQISSSQGVAREESMDPQTTKDTLLSSTSALNPSTVSLADLAVGDDEGAEEDAPSQVVDSAGLGVDREGELVDFSLAPVDFEELEGMEVEESGAAVSDAADVEETGGIADSTFLSN